MMKRIPGALVLLTVAALMGAAAGCGKDMLKMLFGGSHVHSFQPVYKTVYHDAVTHTEEQGHYEIVMVQGSVYQENSRNVYSIVCSCGWYGEADSLSQIDAVWKEHAKGRDTCYGYKSRQHIQRELVKVSDPVYEERWVSQQVTVVDQEAWEERILDHEECVCGAVRP